MRDYKRFINYDNALCPLNEGFFSWLKGLLKNLIKGVFHVNSYEQFVDRLNKMPRIILGLDDKGVDESYSPNVINVINEDNNIPIRSRSRFTNNPQPQVLEASSKNKYKKLSDAIKNRTLNIENEELKKEMEKLNNTIIELENNIDLLNKEKDEIDNESKNKLEELQKKYNDLSLSLLEITDANDKEIKEMIEKHNSELNELAQEVDELRNENEKLRDENKNLKSEIKHMKGEDYKSEFKPITYDDLENKTKMPSFKNALIGLLSSLNDQTQQMNDKVSSEKIEMMRKNLKQKKTINMSDIQIIELYVSGFLNLYSSGKLGLPKPQKGQELNVSELSQYQNVIINSDPSKKFASLYDALEKIVKQYEESFNQQWKEVREMEVKYQQQKSDNASWSGDGDIKYETLKKMYDNELEIEGAINDIIDGCRSLIPNAIMGYFISSPIYKAAEEKINQMLDVLIENEKVVDENKKNPEQEVVKLYNSVMTDTVDEDDKQKIQQASNLFSEKVSAIIADEKLKNKLPFVNDDIFEDIVKNSGIKIIANDNVSDLMRKMQDIKCRLALACLYYVIMQKPLKVITEVDDVDVDLFNLSANNEFNNESNTYKRNLKKIYDFYTWEK